MNIQAELQTLQHRLALIDQLSEEPSSRPSNFLILTLVRLQNIKIKIYEEHSGHSPHVHIDYGKQAHMASYTIKDPERIEGNLSRRYDRAVTTWIEENNDKLLKIWNALKSGKDATEFVEELRVNDKR